MALKEKSKVWIIFMDYDCLRASFLENISGITEEDLNGKVFDNLVQFLIFSKSPKDFMASWRLAYPALPLSLDIQEYHRLRDQARSFQNHAEIMYGKKIQ